MSILGHQFILSLVVEDGVGLIDFESNSIVTATEWTLYTLDSDS